MVPFVSVVIPCYKQAQYLKRSVESVMGQTLANVETIIINDGSPDNCTEVVRNLQATYGINRIRLIEQDNKGLPAARNVGFFKARAVYVLPLDADDYIEDKMLEDCLEKAKAEESDIVYTAFIVIEKGGAKSHCNRVFSIDETKLANQLPATALIKKEIWKRVGGYDESLSGYQDWNFWLSCAEINAKFSKVEKYHFIYDRSKDSMVDKSAKNHKELYKILQDNHPKIYGTDISNKAKVVIMNHNQKETTDVLYKNLSGVFDVSVFDSGSDENSISQYTTHKFPNIYWTGCWQKAIELFGEYDVLWVIGGDVKLSNSANDYKKAIEDAMPFGCWSPVIKGRCLDFMSVDRCDGKIFDVHNLEGICFALSKDVVEKCKQLPSQSEFGWGHDVWMCYQSRQIGLRNVLDGTVCVEHPPQSGYNQVSAHNQMIEMLSSTFGDNWRNTTHKWSDDFRQNVIDDEKKIADVSVVVSSYNQLSALKLALESHRNQSVIPKEVIVADDGSSDETMQWIRTLSNSDYPFVLRFVTQKDQGYRLALINNRAAKEATAKRLLFTNADVLHSPVSILAHAQLTDKQIGAGIILGIKHEAIQNITSQPIKSFDEFKKFAKANESGYNNLQYLKWDLNKQVSGVWGGNMSISRKLYEETGGHNGEYAGWGGEESDLVCRAMKIGANCVWVKDSIVYHLDHPRGQYTVTAEGRKKFRQDYKVPGAGHVFGPINIQPVKIDGNIEISGTLHIRRR